MSNRGHGGRPSKGPRGQHTVRAPLPVSEAGRARAESLGLDFSEYVTLLLAHDLGLDQFAPTPRPQAEQGVLPIGRGDVRLAQSA